MKWYVLHEGKLLDLPKRVYRGSKFGTEVLSVVMELFIQQIELKCTGQMEFGVQVTMA